MTKKTVKEKKCNKKTMKMKKLTTRIKDYMCIKKDICCDDDYDKGKIIDYIIDNYKKLYPDDYVDWINNDVGKFIGYQNILENTKDKKGTKIWNDLSKLIDDEGEQGLRVLFRELPLYYLLSFLGASIYLAENFKYF